MKKTGLSNEELGEVQEAFHLFDADGRGSVSATELKAAFRALGFHVKKVELRQMLLDIDHDGVAGVTFDEFVEVATPKIQARDSAGEIAKVFALFDDDNTGAISFRNLKRVANELGEALTDEELQEMIDEADRDGDGVIGEGEFSRVMKKRGVSPLDDLSSDED